MEKYCEQDMHDSFRYGMIKGIVVASIIWCILIGLAVHFYPYWSQL